MTCRQALALDPDIPLCDILRRDLERLKKQLLRQRTVQLEHVRAIERLLNGAEAPSKRGGEPERS